MIVIKPVLQTVTVSFLLLSFLPSSDGKKEQDEPPKPPVWRDQWHADFSIEWWGNFWYKRSTNKGSYHYDWTNGKSLEEHGEGQQDNWCGCASKESTECKIIAFNEDPNDNSKGNKMPATYAVMPTLDVCCKLFEGEGVLLPDWLKNNDFEGYDAAGEPERQCQKWLNPNPGNALLMKGDLWMLDDNGVPCGYRDVFKWWAKWIFGFGHYFTFDESTYSTDSESSEVFALPTSLDCNVACPNRKDMTKPWCKAAWEPDTPSKVNGEL
jgi:hypothetical protein